MAGGRCQSLIVGIPCFWKCFPCFSIWKFPAAQGERISSKMPELRGGREKSRRRKSDFREFPTLFPYHQRIWRGDRFARDRVISRLERSALAAVVASNSTDQADAAATGRWRHR